MIPGGFLPIFDTGFTFDPSFDSLSQFFLHAWGAILKAMVPFSASRQPLEILIIHLTAPCAGPIINVS